MEDIIGRQKEMKIFSAVLKGNRSEFIAVYGRRRVGKTFLIRNAFASHFVFQLTGLANSDTQEQLVNFNTALIKANKKPKTPIKDTWFAAFVQLEEF